MVLLNADFRGRTRQLFDAAMKVVPSGAKSSPSSRPSPPGRRRILRFLSDDTATLVVGNPSLVPCTVRLHSPPLREPVAEFVGWSSNKTRPARWLSLLPPGEGQDEGPGSYSKKRASIPRPTSYDFSMAGTALARKLRKKTNLGRETRLEMAAQPTVHRV